MHRYNWVSFIYFQICLVVLIFNVVLYTLHGKWYSLVPAIYAGAMACWTLVASSRVR